MPGDLGTSIGVVAQGFSFTDLLLVHAGIIFVLFLHGTLAAVYAAYRFPTPSSLRSWPVVIVLGFMLSIAANGLLALFLSSLDLGIHHLPKFILLIDLLFLLLLSVVFVKKEKRQPAIDISVQEILLAILIIVFFLLMLRNGGLIDRMADSWYHMVLANRIYWGDAFLSNTHLLTGDEYTASFLSYNYRQLWHLNLSLIAGATNIPLPLVWHALAAWVVSVTLCSYYVFTQALTRKRNIAILSTLIFCVALGGINSYFRVASWPGNTSYILMYLFFFLSFTILDSFSSRDHTTARISNYSFLKCWKLMLHRRAGSIILISVFAIALVTDLFLHMSEIFWYALGMFFYALALHSLRLKEISPSSHGALAFDRCALSPFLYIFGGFLFGFVLMKNPSLLYPLIFLFGTLVLLVFRGSPLFESYVSRFPALRSITLILLYVAVFLLIDFQQLFQLIAPLSIGDSIHIPREAVTGQNYTLFLPNWDHQLRAAYLYSGLLGVVGSIYLVVKEKSRSTVFLFATSVFSFISLLSPSSFTMLIELSSRSTAYRVHLLLFHPIVLSLLLFLLYDKISLLRNEHPS